MLTAEQRVELKQLGLQNARFKIGGSPGGRDAVLNRFLKSGDVVKGDVEDWLVENSSAETAQQRATLLWARIAGWAGIIGVVLAAASLAYTIWCHK
jgi:hypothetical protein